MVDIWGKGWRAEVVAVSGVRGGGHSIVAGSGVRGGGLIDCGSFLGVWGGGFIMPILEATRKTPALRANTRLTHDRLSRLRNEVGINEFSPCGFTGGRTIFLGFF